MVKYRFKNMCEIIPEGARGSADITHIVIDQNASFRSMFSHRPAIESVEPGTYCRLSIDGVVMMSDTQMERNSNFHALRWGGDILIAGLGIGMIIVPMLENDDVKSITVIEMNPHVITLVARHLRKLDTKGKFKIIQANIDEWSPEVGQKFDAIYFDIWPNIDTDNLPHIAKLHQRGKFWKRNKTSYMGSWMEEYLRSEKRSSSSNYPRLWL